jgi:hypothetical protein
MNSQQLKQLETFVAPGLYSLLGSKELTEQHLNDENPKVRWAAVVLMTYHWELTDRFRLQCQELALHDPDLLVRSKAVGCLGACYAGTANRQIASLLAKLVCDPSESSSVRLAAYSAIVIVNSGKAIGCPKLIPNLRFPEDVDWKFVNSML